MGTAPTRAPEPPLPPKSTLKRVTDAAWEFICHTILLIVLLTCIRGAEDYTKFLWGAGKVFQIRFASIPLQALFDGADVFLIIGILTIGTYATMRRYLD
jgi:hypothetical protein